MGNKFSRCCGLNGGNDEDEDSYGSPHKPKQAVSHSVSDSIKAKAAQPSADPPSSVNSQQKTHNHEDIIDKETFAQSTKQQLESWSVDGSANYRPLNDDDYDAYSVDGEQQVQGPFLVRSGSLAVAVPESVGDAASSNATSCHSLHDTQQQQHSGKTSSTSALPKDIGTPILRVSPMKLPDDPSPAKSVSSVNNSKSSQGQRLDMPPPQHKCTIKKSGSIKRKHEFSTSPPPPSVAVNGAGDAAQQQQPNGQWHTPPLPVRAAASGSKKNKNGRARRSRRSQQPRGAASSSSLSAATGGAVASLLPQQSPAVHKMATPLRHALYGQGAQSGLLDKERLEAELCDGQARARYWEQFAKEHKLQHCDLLNNNNNNVAANHHNNNNNTKPQPHHACAAAVAEPY